MPSTRRKRRKRVRRREESDSSSECEDEHISCPLYNPTSSELAYFYSQTPSSQRSYCLLHLSMHDNSAEMPLRFKVLNGSHATHLKKFLMARLAQKTDEKSCQYVEHALRLPVGPTKPLEGPGASLLRAAYCSLNDSIYGQADAKATVLKNLSMYLCNPNVQLRPMAFQGPPGVGKTALAKNGVAKALNRAFVMVALGGQNDVSFLSGHSYTYESSTYGAIASAMMEAKSVNPVLLFDEVDKVGTRHGREVENLLIHLTDPMMNHEYVDRYFGPELSIDMSKAFLVFSMNDASLVSKVLLDRMDIVTLQPYSVDDKVQIAKLHLIPRALRRVKLSPGEFCISDAALRKIVGMTGSVETGVRALERTIEDIVQEAIMHKEDLRDILPGTYLNSSAKWNQNCLTIDCGMVNDACKDTMPEGCPPMSMYT